LRLLRLTQIENGKAFYINPDEIASVNPVAKLRAEVIVGEDNQINYTLITLKNGVKCNAKESPYEVAQATADEGIKIVRPASSGPRADYTAKHGHAGYNAVTDPAPAWSPDANLERSKAVSPSGPTAKGSPSGPTAKGYDSGLV
jgi:uncharacterized protein YlzI (FlbEa/FlbD family)